MDYEKKYNELKEEFDAFMEVACDTKDELKREIKRLELELDSSNEKISELEDTLGEIKHLTRFI